MRDEVAELAFVVSKRAARWRTASPGASMVQTIALAPVRSARAMLSHVIERLALV